MPPVRAALATGLGTTRPRGTVRGLATLALAGALLAASPGVAAQEAPILDEPPAVGPEPGQEHAAREVDPRPYDEDRLVRHPSSGPVRIAGYVAAAAGLVVLGAALGVHLWNDGRFGDWSAEHFLLHRDWNLPLGESASDDELRARVEANNDLLVSIHAADRATWALLGVGLGSAAASLALLFVASRLDRRARIGLTPTAHGLAATLVLELP